MYSDQRLCQPCLDLRFAHHFLNDSGNDIDWSAHPGFATLKTLGDSGKTCDLCMFFYEEGMKVVRASGSGALDSAIVQPFANDSVLSIEMYWPGINELRICHGDGERGAMSQYAIATNGSSMQNAIKVIDEVPRSPFDPRSLVKMRAWLHECDATHSSCQHGADLDSSKFQQFRLLDVGTLEMPQLRLRTSDGSTRDRYIALSHCWGKSQQFVLDRDNYDSFQAMIDEAKAPKTFQDTFYLARLLGVRFVWIDSLCIKQDDRNDWEVQSAQMGRIYESAYLTVAASRSSDDAHGFLHDRRPAAVKCGMASVGGSEHDAFISECLKDSMHEQVQSEPLTSRGWTVQERLLSRRTIFFGSRQTFWQCQTKVKFEDGRNHDHDQEQQDDWRAIVREFSSCDLTKASDKLPAIAGVASKYGLQTGHAYLAGHWLDPLDHPSLIQSLCWRPASTDSSTKPSSRAPSWSWASQDGEIWLGGPGDTVARIVDHSIQLVSEASPYGEVLAGHLRVSGPLVQVDLVDDRKYINRARFHGDRLAIHRENLLIFDGPEPRNSESFDEPQYHQVPSISIAIISDGVFGYADGYRCILLSPCEHEPDCYQRVGVVEHLRIEEEDFNKIKVQEYILK